MEGVHSEAQWAVAKDGIYFFRVADKLGHSDLSFYDFSSGQAKKIVTVPHRVDNRIAVSPDGRSILYPEFDSLGADLMLVENFR